MTPEDAAGAPVIVLVRPQLGENVGTAARAMLNFGLKELRLVAPQCGWPNAKAVVACSGAYEVLHGASIFESVEAAIGDLHSVFATTARPRGLKKPVITGDAAATEARRLAGEGRRVGFLFGAERTGLTNEELLLADAILSIPLNPDFSSLNLAQAVLLVGYELFKAGDRTPALRHAPKEGELATKSDVDGLLDQLVRSLDRVDFFKSDNRRQGLVRTIKVMVERRAWTRPEVNLFRGIVKELAEGRRRDG
jgi:tRNA/rRNA methyltransferase